MTYQSVTFGSNGEIVNTDLESHVRPATALSDGQKANVGITINQSDFTRYQQHTGTEQGTSSARVQLLQDDGLVKIGGFEVRPEVAERLAKVAPGFGGEPSVKAEEAAKAADTAKAEEISREELNRHPGEIEGYHQHITGEVSQQSLISLMVYAQRGEAPPASLISNIARDMGETVDNAVAKVNLVNQGVQAQFTVLARSMNLDADKAADWLRDHRKDTSMAALQAHYLRRDLQAWTPLLEDYRAATGDGRSRQ
jgi:hypothetical protein